MSYGGKEKNCQWPKKKGDFTHHSHIGLLDAREARIAEVQQEQGEVELLKGRDICVFLELGGTLCLLYYFHGLLFLVMIIPSICFC